LGSIRALLTIAIIGLGLIGGSVGLGLTESGFAAKVLGFDRDPRVRLRALERRCIHEQIIDLRQAVQADIWVIATPPLTVPPLLGRLDGLVKPTGYVTDCASVKETIVKSVPASFRTRFVGGHPMAGFQESGIEFARVDLFCDATWILTPEQDVQRKALSRIESMVYALDAKPVKMTAHEHDEHVAILSHVPHALASLLVLLAERLDQPKIAGGSWRDLTRVAGSHPELWEQIFASNREVILKTLSDMGEQISSLKDLLESNDREGLCAFFQAANAAKRRQH
jgi:prephenate dehydrogenase